jgi:hypothetical protein
MYGNANCYANILRATEENSDGDEVQAGTDRQPVYTKIPMSIIERTKSVFDPSGLVPRTIRVTTGRCNGDLVLQEDDQIFDLTHQRLFWVTTCSRGDSVVAAGDWVLQLERVTGGAATP